MPLRNATGMKTAHNTSMIEMIGRVTSAMAACAAALGASPLSILRSTFSTTTIASSTTMPVASTRPNKRQRIDGKAGSNRTASVPTMATGTATSGTTLARQLCRNTTTTSTTSATASSSVVDDRLDRAAHEHRRIVRNRVAHTFREASSTVPPSSRRTSSDNSSAFAPGR